LNKILLFDFYPNLCYNRYIRGKGRNEMAVAKSYENMTICGEPYKEDGKMYVKVIGPCKRCGGSGHYSYNPMDGTTCFGCNGTGKTSMIVRWYTDAQRATMDKATEKRKAAAAVKQEERRIKSAARNAFGFGEKGYITLIYGDNDTIKKWREDLPEHTVWYNNTFGWFIPSTKMIEGHSAVLQWEQVRNIDDEENLQMISNEDAHKIVVSLTVGESKSQWQGIIGDWLEPIEVKVIKNISFSNSYGDSHMHILHDEDGNEYVWTTGSKNLEEGKVLKLKMKVKNHSDYNGVKQTIVWYCKESK